MKKPIIVLAVLLCSCGSVPKVNHVHVKEKKGNAMNKQKPTPVYWALVIFGGLTFAHVMTQPE